MSEAEGAGVRPSDAAQPARVLIAHQSTIPHYRVPFYNALERRRPPHWTFTVVYDSAESRSPRIYPERVDSEQFSFPTLDARTHILRIGSHKLIYQHFLSAAARYDIVVTDTHFSNLTYLALWAYRAVGMRRVLWGHARDMNVERMKAAKRLSERAKQWLLMRSDHFLAYTEGVRGELLALGYPGAKITVVNNTIDTRAERDAFLRNLPRREEFRRELGVAGKCVLLYAGRLRPGNRFEFLIEAFAALRAAHKDFHLFVAGGGELFGLSEQARNRFGAEAMTLFGPLTDPQKLAAVFTASDFFVLPGQVGLACVHALCYELPVLAFALRTHGPEYEYLSPENSLVLPEATTPAEFAGRLPEILGRWPPVGQRGRLFETIRHLSVESMADAFIAGINCVLGGGRAC